MYDVFNDGPDVGSVVSSISPDGSMDGELEVYEGTAV